MGLVYVMCDKDAYSGVGSGGGVGGGGQNFPNFVKFLENFV